MDLHVSLSLPSPLPNDLICACKFRCVLLFKDTSFCTPYHINDLFLDVIFPGSAHVLNFGHFTLVEMSEVKAILFVIERLYPLNSHLFPLSYIQSPIFFSYHPLSSSISDVITLSFHEILKNKQTLSELIFYFNHKSSNSNSFLSDKISFNCKLNLESKNTIFPLNIGSCYLDHIGPKFHPNFSRNDLVLWISCFNLNFSTPINEYFVFKFQFSDSTSNVPIHCIKMNGNYTSSWSTIVQKIDCFLEPIKISEFLIVDLSIIESYLTTHDTESINFDCFLFKLGAKKSMLSSIKPVLVAKFSSEFFEKSDLTFKKRIEKHLKISEIDFVPMISNFLDGNLIFNQGFFSTKFCREPSIFDLLSCHDKLLTSTTETEISEILSQTFQLFSSNLNFSTNDFSHFFLKVLKSLWFFGSISLSNHVINEPLLSRVQAEPRNFPFVYHVF
ncbi:hypothetical protein RCL1_008533 [Eukaryota sp. TZLM3-RCL]